MVSGMTLIRNGVSAMWEELLAAGWALLDTDLPDEAAWNGVSRAQVLWCAEAEPGRVSIGRLRRLVDEEYESCVELGTVTPELALALHLIACRRDAMDVGRVLAAATLISEHPEQNVLNEPPFHGFGYLTAAGVAETLAVLPGFEPSLASAVRDRIPRRGSAMWSEADSEAFLATRSRHHSGVVSGEDDVVEWMRRARLTGDRDLALSLLRQWGAERPWTFLNARHLIDEYQALGAPEEALAVARTVVADGIGYQAGFPLLVEAGYRAGDVCAVWQSLQAWRRYWSSEACDSAPWYKAWASEVRKLASRLTAADELHSEVAGEVAALPAFLREHGI